MGWIERRGQKWRVVYRVGDRRRTRTFPTKSAARTFLANYEVARQRGQVYDPDRAKTTVTAWCEACVATHPGKPNTVAGMTSRVKSHIAPTIGRLALYELTPAKVQGWVTHLWRERELSASTVRLTYGTLARFMDQAVAEGLIRRNPCRDVVLPEARTPERLFLNDVQVRRVIDHTPEAWKPLVVTLIGTGLRFSEAAGLRVGKVDLLADPPTLAVSQIVSQINGKIVYGTPKSARSRRVVTLPEEVRDVLLPLVAGRADDEHVFTTITGMVLRYGNFHRDVWLSIAQDAELPGLRIHDLRHTHASHLIAAGVPLPVISRRLGHQSIQVTVDTYGHLTRESDGPVLAALDRLLGANPTPDTPVTGKPQVRD